MIWHPWNFAHHAMLCIGIDRGELPCGAFLDIRNARSRDAFRYSVIASDMHFRMHAAERGTL